MDSYHHIYKPHRCSFSHHWFGQEQKVRCSYAHAGKQRKHEEQPLLHEWALIATRRIWIHVFVINEQNADRNACAEQLGYMCGVQWWNTSSMDTHSVRWATESIGGWLRT